MKLKTRFVVLVAGIVIIPFLVYFLVLMINRTSETGEVRLPKYPVTIHWLRSAMQKSGATEESSPIQEKAKDPPDFIVLEEDGIVSSSTINGFSTGDRVTLTDFFYHAKQYGGDYFFHFDIVRTETGKENLVFFQTHRPENLRKPKLILFRFLGVYSLIGIILFVVIFSVLLVRSLTTSIILLENATRHVAEGNLDFELRKARSKDEIASLTRSFESMRKALKEEYARRARFLMGVSHDLKTPLSLIEGYAEAIEDGMASDANTQKKYLSIIKEKAKSLERMVAQLLDFVKMETGEWKQNHVPIEAKEFFMELGEQFKEDSAIYGRRFELRLEVPRSVSISMDRDLAYRAFENILGNAIRYTREGDTISLTVLLDADTLKVEIKDTGTGIPEEELPFIFDPFYRGTSSRREEGSGLGLAVVKSVMESHGWKIEASSGKKGGTTFKIEIPIL
ncbi:MAG: hypothetical protein DRP87_06640 [Spirochaetes bacterium]|nr:MAG: hypothetical protein DRP87_06640 [Spirochaetota bacterium]